MNPVETLTPPAPAPLLALARSHVAWRKHFQDSPPEEQEAILQEQARALAIYGAPIGVAAVRIGAALDELLEAVEDFRGEWEDDACGHMAVRAALEAAGLEKRPKDFREHDERHFDSTFRELNIWWPVLEVIRERLDDCNTPHTETGDGTRDAGPDAPEQESAA